MAQSLVTLKAYGDFVIACKAIQNFDRNAGAHVPRLIAGSHCKSLANALGVQHHIKYIGSNWTDVPAIFNLKKSSLQDAIMSLIDIRKQISLLPDRDELIFDRIGWRERFISYGRNAIQPSLDRFNIYAAYNKLFQTCSSEIDNSSRSNVTNVLIIPGSRVKYKVIPSPVLKKIVSPLNLSNISTSCLVLDNEAIDVPSDLPLYCITPKFENLVSAIKRAELIISADSLSAHIAEFLSIPVFVCSPLPNTFWLPLSALRYNRWVTFDEVLHSNNWFSKLPV